MQNDATTAITGESVSKIVALSNHAPEVLDFTTLATAAASADDKKP